jgi:putative hydrolase of the HAD superfamily
MSEYKALLIDLDGVIRIWPASAEEIEITCGLPVNALETTAFRKELLGRAITGELSDEEWRRRTVAALLEQFPQSKALEAVTTWSARTTKINTPLLELIANLRKRLTVALISNATSRLNEDLAMLGLNDQFDHIINSSEVGYSKPSPEIFHHALTLVNATPTETLYVDDALNNIEAASKLGISTHHYQRYEDFITFVAQSLRE